MIPAVVSEFVHLDIKYAFQEVKMKYYGHRQIQVELIETLCEKITYMKLIRTHVLNMHLCFENPFRTLNRVLL